MATGDRVTRSNEVPASTAHAVGLGAFWGTCVGFPIWGLVSFFLSRNANIDLSLSVAALVTGALGGALAAYMTRTRHTV
jgi:hypothetical protein